MEKARISEEYLKSVGFTEAGLHRREYVPMLAKGWVIGYVEELKGYYIEQSFEASAWIPCKYVESLEAFLQLIDVKLK
jgi:hypothetical protein